MLNIVARENHIGNKISLFGYSEGRHSPGEQETIFSGVKEFREHWNSTDSLYNPPRLYTGLVLAAILTESALVALLHCILVITHESKHVFCCS